MQPFWQERYECAVKLVIHGFHLKTESLVWHRIMHLKLSWLLRELGASTAYTHIAYVGQRRIRVRYLDGCSIEIQNGCIRCMCAAPVVIKV